VNKLLFLPRYPACIGKFYHAQFCGDVMNRPTVSCEQELTGLTPVAILFSCSKFMYM